MLVFVKKKVKKCSVRGKMIYICIMFEKSHKKILFFGIFFLFVSVQNISGQENFSQNDSIDKTVNLDTVLVVQSQRTKLTGISSGTTKLHIDGIAPIPSLMGMPDLLKVLELTPGVQTSGEGKSNIYVRGGDPGQTLLLYAGIPVYTPGHALNVFPLFNADHLSTVELIKGGVDAGYGDFVSGIIISKPKENVPQKTSVKGNAGLLASNATLDLRVNDKFGAYVSGRISYLNLLLNPLLNLTIGRAATDNLENISYDFFDVNATVVGKLSDKNKLLVNFFMGQDKLDIVENIVGAGGILNWKNYAASGKLETDLSKNSTMEQQISYSRFENKLNVSLSDISVATFSEISSIGYDNNMKYKIGKHYFESGVQYKYYHLLPQEFEMRQSDLISPDVSYGKNTAHYLSVFASATLNFIPRLTLEPGIRYNFFYSEIDKTNKTKDFHSADFRLFSKFQIHKNQSVRATFSHNNQYVSKLFPSSTGLPTDFWVAASNEILPLSSNDVSLGYYQSFLNGILELSSDAYFRSMKNVVEYNQNFIDNDNSIFTEKIRFGRGRAYGIELMLKANYKKISAWLSYSLGRSERKFAEINNGEYFPARHDRTHDLSFTGTYTLNKKWDFSITQVYATGNAYTAPTSWYFIGNTPVKEYGKHNAQRLPHYNRTDIGINFWYKKDNGINLSIYNIFVVRNPLYVSLRVNEVEDAKDRIVVSMKKHTLFTIMPSISWRFKF